MTKNHHDYSIYDQETNEMIANSLEEYLDLVSRLVILEGTPKKLVDDSKAVIKKAIKNLRDGKPEKVFDEERYEMMINLRRKDMRE